MVSLKGGHCSFSSLGVVSYFLVSSFVKLCVMCRLCRSIVRTMRPNDCDAGGESCSQVFAVCCLCMYVY